LEPIAKEAVPVDGTGGVVKVELVPLPLEKLERAKAIMAAATAPGAKFDKKAYQRDLMRARRAKAKLEEGE
jgi:hypothetical protein